MTATPAQRSAYIHAAIGILASAVLAGLTAVAGMSAGQLNWGIVSTVFLCVFLATLVHVGLAYETQAIAALPSTDPNKAADTDTIARFRAIADVLEGLTKTFLPPSIRSSLTAVDSAPLVHIYTGNTTPTITTTTSATTDTGAVTTTETTTPASIPVNPPAIGDSISDATTQTIETKEVSKAMTGGGATTIPLSNEDTLHRVMAVKA